MKVVVVDDDQLVAISLKTILESDSQVSVAATGNDGKDAVALYESEHPDVLLLDIQMKEMSGLEAAEQILEKDPAAKILFLTTFSDDEYIIKALNLGAKGYILKQDFEGLLPALLAVEQGQSVFGGEVVNKLPVLMQTKNSFDYRGYDIGEKPWRQWSSLRIKISEILRWLSCIILRAEQKSAVRLQNCIWKMKKWNCAFRRVCFIVMQI